MVKFSWNVLADTKGQKQNLYRCCPRINSRNVRLPCCNVQKKKKSQCKSLIPNIEKAALKWRISYASLDPKDRRELLFNSIKRWITPGEDRVRWHFVHPETNHEYRVCRKAFRHLTGIGCSLLVTCENEILHGYSGWVGKRSILEYNRETVAPYYRAWIEWQIQHAAEHQPDATYVNFRCGSRIGFFYQFENDWKALGTVLLPSGWQPNLKTFYSILSEFKGRIGWHRYIRFNKCEVCACIGAKIARSKFTQERAELRRMWHVHNTWQMFEVPSGSFRNLFKHFGENMIFNFNTFCSGKPYTTSCCPRG